MHVEPDYRGHRIQVDAVAVNGRWNATTRIRRLFTEERARVETVTCYKLTAELAETRAMIVAKRSVDLVLEGAA